MPNITFEEKQGASILRRILAGFWIILAFGGAIALVNMTPKLYNGQMNICFKKGSKGEVLSRVESVLNKNSIPDITIDNVTDERLTISAQKNQKPLIASSLLILKDYIIESIRADIESQYNTDKQEFDNTLNMLNDKLSSLNTNTGNTDEYYTLIAEIRDSLQNHTMLPVGWEVMFEDNIRFKSILQELIANITEIEEINIALKTEASKMLVLSEWINAAENQTVQITEKRVVHYEDTPELIRLKDLKAETEASRMRLLKRATTKHPVVIRMSEEIDELQAQINALTRTPQIVEDVREITNPKLAEFNSNIIITRSNIAALNSKRDTLTARTIARLDDLELLVKDSQQDRDSSIREHIQQEIADFKKSPVKIMNSPIIGYIISNNITRVEGPNLYLIYSLAAFIGITGAFLIMYSSKKSSFKLEEVEATPEFPVLGKIGRIGGSEIRQN